MASKFTQPKQWSRTTVQKYNQKPFPPPREVDSTFIKTLLSIVARQRLGKNVIAAKNTHATEKLLDVSFSIRSVSYQGEVGEYSFQELLI
jgi:hypothetical protein